MYHICYSNAMVITYFGKSYFKLSLGDLTIAINPPTKDSKAFGKVPRFGADIALITTHTARYQWPGKWYHWGIKEPLCNRWSRQL